MNQYHPIAGRRLTGTYHKLRKGGHFISDVKLILVWIIAHVPLGYYSTRSNQFSRYWAYAILIIGVYKIVQSRNRNGMAHIFAGYIMGYEIFLRMNRTYILWEFGKYAVIFFLVLGILTEKKFNKKGQIFLLYALCLAPP